MADPTNDVPPLTAAAQAPDPLSGAFVSPLSAATASGSLPMGVLGMNPDLINDPVTLSRMMGGQSGAPQAALASPQGDSGLNSYASGIFDPSNSSAEFQRREALRDQAAQQKSAAINSAMNRILAGQSSDSANLPALALASGFLKPTRQGFGASIGQALDSAIPVAAQQKQRDLATAQAVGQLGVQASDIPLQVSSQDLQDFMSRAKLGEQAAATNAVVGGRSDVANISAQARQQVAAEQSAARDRAAQITANGRIGVADIMADRNSWKYLGTDPSNPGQGIFQNTRLGSINYGPAINDPKQAQDPARIREATDLVSRGVAPDFTTAYGMVRSGVNEPNQFNSAVQHELQLLQNTPGYGGKAPAELENMARENVVSRLAAGRGQATPGAPPLPPGGAAQPTPSPTPQPRPAVPAGGGQATPTYIPRQATPDEVAAAKAAISSGADRATVMKRFNDSNITLPGDL